MNSDHPTEFLDLGSAGPDEPEPIAIIHKWGPRCPCAPTGNGTELRHHHFDGTGWTERVTP